MLAPNREGLVFLTTTKPELGRLAQVEALLAEHYSACPPGTPPPPSVLSGVLARFKLGGQYRLRPVVGVEAAAAGGGTPATVLLQAPEAAAAGAVRRIPLAAVSSTNPLDEQHWEAAGQGEAAELAAAWQLCGYVMSLADAAGAAWRKQAALQWQAQHWGQAQQERQQQIPMLLAALTDAGGLALMRQQLAAAQPAAVVAASQPTEPAASRPQSSAPPAAPQPLPPAQPAASQPQPPATQPTAAPLLQLSTGTSSRKQQRQQQRRPEDSAAAAAAAAAAATAAEASQGVAPPRPASSSLTPAPPTAVLASPLPAALDALAVLPGVPAGDLPAAHAALVTALYRAVPANERDAAAKRAALAALLRLGLSSYGRQAGTFRQLPVPASEVQDALREAAARDGEVAQQLALLALQGGPALLPVAARLLTACHDRGLVSASGGPDSCQLLLHVNHLAEAYLRGIAPPRSGMSEQPWPRTVSGRRSRSRSPPHRGRSRSPPRRGRSPPRRRSVGSPPDRPSGEGQGLPLMPLLLHYPNPRQQPEWVLIGQEVFINGLAQQHPRHVVMARLKALLEGGGAKLLSLRHVPGDARGDLAYATLPSAQQAAQLVRRLQGCELEGKRLFLREAKKEVDGKMKDSPHIAEAALLALHAARTAAAGPAPLQGPPGPMPLPPGPHAGSWGRPATAGGVYGMLSSRRSCSMSPPRRPIEARRSRSPLPAGGPPAPFWDPEWQLEWDCLQRLQAAGNLLTLRELLGQLVESVAWPQQLGVPSTGPLYDFLLRRTYIFSLDDARRPAAVPGAETWLRWKRALLQFLADHPRRVDITQLESALPPPPRLPQAMRNRKLSDLVMSYLGREVWFTHGKRAYRNGLFTVELQPFAAGAGGPRFPPICPYFKNMDGRQCPNQERCDLPHAPWRRTG